MADVGQLHDLQDPEMNFLSIFSFSKNCFVFICFLEEKRVSNIRFDVPGTTS